MKTKGVKTLVCSSRRTYTISVTATPDGGPSAIAAGNASLVVVVGRAALVAQLAGGRHAV